MGQDLFHHGLFIDEADDTHLTGASGTRKRVHLPHFFYTLSPHELRYWFWLIISDIDDSAVLTSFVIILSPFPLFLLLPLSPRIRLLYHP